MINRHPLEYAYSRHEPITENQRALIWAVISEIDAYEGEEIRKDEHPLWRAVVALENVMDRRANHNRLYYPAAGHWYRGLWASRPDMPNMAVGGPREYGDKKNYPTHADGLLAKLHFAELRTVLEYWLERSA